MASWVHPFGRSPITRASRRPRTVTFSFFTSSATPCTRFVPRQRQRFAELGGARRAAQCSICRPSDAGDLYDRATDAERLSYPLTSYRRTRQATGPSHATSAGDAPRRVFLYPREIR